MKHINSSESEQILETVDTVLFDIDGVLLHNVEVIPGSNEFVKKVRKLGKRVGFVTNGAIYTKDALMSRLHSFDAMEEEIVNPNNSFVYYLKQSGFKKDIYVICSTVTKNILRETGFNVIEYKDINDKVTIEEDFDAILEFSKKCLDICKNVGAVLIDIDLRSGVPDLQVAHTLLNHMKDLLLICGARDDSAPMGNGLTDINDKVTIEEDFDAILEISKKCLDICKNVGAVLIDVDLRSGLPDLQVAHTLLNHMKDLLLICGARDDSGPMGNDLKIIAPMYYIELIERLSHRQCVQLAKPGRALKDVLVPIFNIKDDKRVLFVGDSVQSDIAFGTICGFQTLLVLSGSTTKEAVEDWKFPEIHRPDYVADSLKELIG